MKSLLLEHYKRYPRMQIQDIVKLIYQNEFAGGHLIKNVEDSLLRITQEYNSLNPSFSSPPFTFEDIGNGLCRLHLSKCKEEQIDVNTINRLFVSTANTVRGSIKDYEVKLDKFRKYCTQDILPYDINELNDYIIKYKNDGYPLVSHSETYRKEYMPHYRIVKKTYCDFIKVFSKIDTLLKKQDKVFVAIDGRSSAGKSTLASIIKDVYDCNVFHMDDFFLTPAQKTKERLDEVGGNIDYERFYNDVMLPLKSNNDFSYKRYDCKTGALSNPIKVSPKRLNIIEGVYSMHPTLLAQYDLKIFLDIDDESQSARILERNGEYMHQRFKKEWIPLENRYFKYMDTILKSDLYYDVTMLDSTLIG